MKLSVLQARAGGAVLPAGMNMVIAVDFGTNPDLPLFVGGSRLLRDLFDLPISVGTIHNRLQVAAEQAAAPVSKLISY